MRSVEAVLIFLFACIVAAMIFANHLTDRRDGYADYSRDVEISVCLSFVGCDDNNR